jgi:Cupin-like domain
MIQFEPVKRVETVTRDDFLHDYKAPKTPVVIGQLTAAWPARNKWTLEYLGDVAGDKIVPLYGSQAARGRRHQHAPVARMKLREYIALLEGGENNLRLFFFNLMPTARQLIKDFAYPDIGLKFFTKLPVLFMGGEGAKVQMHFDIDLADILLCHFGGGKRVYLFPPEQTPYLYRVPFSFSCLHGVNIENPDYEKYPALQYARGFVAELTHGDALYIPSGYWHYVVYQELGFSMSLRAFPRRPRELLKLVYNILFIRNIDGLMRKVVGQAWNDWNELRAVRNTQEALLSRPGAEGYAKIPL